MAKNKPEGKLPNHALVREELDTPKKHDLSHQRDERCIPVAHQLLKSLGNLNDLLVGSHINEKVVLDDPYLPIIREIMTLMIKSNLKVADTTYVFALARQAIQAIENGIDETLNQNMNRVTELVYDLPLNDFNEVTIKKLNDVVQRREKIVEAWKPILDDESLSQEIK